MEKTFNNFNEFTNYFKRSIGVSEQKETEIVNKSLMVSAKMIQEEVKSKFGHYQDGWEELSDATKKDRVSKGYTENDPLLRDGTLRDSVTVEVLGKTAIIGSKNPIMVYQEKGTSATGWGKGIPPRPVFLSTYHTHAKESVSVFFKSLTNLIRDKL